MSLIPGLDTLRTVGVGLMVAGICSIGAGLGGYFKGKIAGKAEVQTILDKAVANANAAAAIASENYRRSEAEWQDKIAKAQTSYTERQAQHETELASVRAAAAADVGKLRRALSRVAASGAAPSDSTPPQVTAPAPQGSYWAKVCNYRQSLQETLKLTLTPIEPCLLGGPDKPQPNVR